tara:strand:+ start:192 stop:488 length:297 start_codon:yes stop_codon:yes gene_type:complete
MNSLDKDWHKTKPPTVSSGNRTAQGRLSRYLSSGLNAIVQLPKESYGICKTVKCRTSDLTVSIDLANGVCQACWDSGLGGQRTYGFDKPRKSKAKAKE